MIIEFYAKQNKNKLREDVILVYKFIVEKVKDFIEEPDYETWHPEKNTNFDDTWKIIELLNCFGYTGYDFDGVLYTFYINSGNNNSNDVSGDGLNFPQAVCNCLVKFYEMQIK